MLAHTSPSSRGQDAALSRRKPGFNSPWGRQLVQCAGLAGLPASAASSRAASFGSLAPTWSPTGAHCARAVSAWSWANAPATPVGRMARIARAGHGPPRSLTTRSPTRRARRSGAQHRRADWSWQLRLMPASPACCPRSRGDPDSGGPLEEDPELRARRPANRSGRHQQLAALLAGSPSRERDWRPQRLASLKWRARAGEP